MKEKKDALLQQIAENNRDSTVFFVTGYLTGHPVRFSKEQPEMLEISMATETATGFFVEPDKIVTTIQTLAGAVAVAAIPADRFTRTIASRVIRLLHKGNHRQVREETGVTIEGVTAVDLKNNLVLLKIAETGVPLPLGDSDTALIGEKVWTLGYRDNMKYMGTAGTLQSRYKDDKWFQIETQFTPGTGGGPVLNSENQVIGVATSGTESAIGDNNATIATVISSNVLRKLLANSRKVMPLKQLQKYSRVRAYVLEAEAGKKAERHDNKGAIKVYTAALKLNPDLVEIYFKRGILKTRIDNLQGAFKDFDTMIRINPEHIFAYNNRASTRANLGDEQGAIDDLNKAIQLNPDYIMAYINLGQAKGQIATAKMDEKNIAEAQRYYQEAIDAYTKALALNPKNRLVRKQRKNVKRALKLLKILSAIGA